MMGEVVGKAAWICVRHHTSPRGVYDQYLDILKDLRPLGQLHESFILAAGRDAEEGVAPASPALSSPRGVGHAAA